MKIGKKILCFESFFISSHVSTKNLVRSIYVKTQNYQVVYHDDQIQTFFVSTCKPLLKGATVGYGGKVTNVVG